METYRVRIRHAEGGISVVDKSFSQTIDMLKDLSREMRNMFFDKQAEVTLPNGDTAYLVKQN